MEISIALMADQLAIKFIDVKEKYSCNENIECKYIFNNYSMQNGDRIAIFEMGWKSLRNYILFEWAAEPQASGINTVTFNRFDLPKTVGSDLFQFCYVSGENVVQGISTLFQIYEAPGNNLTDSLKKEQQFTHLRQIVGLKDKEIMKLREDNAVLKESLRALVNQRQCQAVRSYDTEINELKDMLTSLKNAFVEQQKEIEELKSEVKKDKAENKNLMLEKILAEKKFDVVCGKKEVKHFNLDFDLGSLQPLPPFPFDEPSQS